jgi:hypothetical protein
VTHVRYVPDATQPKRYTRAMNEVDLERDREASERERERGRGRKGHGEVGLVA